MSDLHGEIMNIPCDPSRAPVAGVNAELAYKYGHRDARHAAAELAAAHGAERAQPAEAKGVEVPVEGYILDNNGHSFTRRREDFWTAKAAIVPLVRQSDHLAALSAVTAERDRVLAEAHGQMVEAFAERDEVIAERDRLRKDKAELKHRLTNEQQKTFVAEVQMVEIGDQRNQLRAEVERLLGAMRQIRYARNNGPVSENNAGCIRRIEQIADAAMTAKEGA